MSFSSSCRVPVALALLAACNSTTPATGGGNQTAASISLSETAISFDALGRSVSVTATVRDQEDQPIPNASVAWSLSGTGGATVSSTGTVTSFRNGVDTVTATVGAISAKVIVTVDQIPVAIDLTASSLALSQIGATLQVSGRVIDSNNREVSGANIDWASSEPLILPIDNVGVVTAAGIGASIITASSGTFSDEIVMQVTISGPVGPAVVGGGVSCTGGTAGNFPCSGIDLVSYVPNGGVGAGAGVSLNDIWGWTDQSSGREYVIVGRDDGVAFIDVSDAERPRYLGYMPVTPGSNPNSWHDMKVYSDHVFVVADGAGAHGMQVFDLTRLRNPAPTPQTFSANTVYNNVRSAHNIFINEATGFAFITGASSGGTTCGGGLHMVNIQNPTAPSFAGCFSDPQTGRSGTGYSHDAQCVVYNGPDVDYQGREICLNSNETHLSIADVTNKGAPVAITRANYPGVSYTHQGWLTEDQAYFLVNDELDDGASFGTRTLIWDVADLDDPVLVTQFLGETEATDHNHYVRGNYLYASNYQFGLRILDIADPTNPSQVGFFDTAPQLSNVGGFGGSWSNYPYFESGIIVVTSRSEGLFVLRMQ